MPEPVVLSWSGGKDCALALDALRCDARYEVVALASSFCQETDRLPIHEVPRGLIRAQAASLGLRLYEVNLPNGASNAEYEASWSIPFASWKQHGIRCVAFGDLFLSDIRKFREDLLLRHGLTCLFPIWELPSREAASTLIAHGWQAVICSVSSAQLDPKFLGRRFDKSLQQDLPQGIDPCGENGEFHTFVYGGPGFTRDIPWVRGNLLRHSVVDYIELLADLGGETNRHAVRHKTVRRGGS